LVCPEEAWLLAEIEKLLKRQIPRVADTGYEPVSLKIVDAPKKNAPNKNTGKKDYRHTKKPATRGAKPAQGERNKKGERHKAKGTRHKAQGTRHKAQGTRLKAKG